MKFILCVSVSVWEDVIMEGMRRGGKRMSKKSKKSKKSNRKKKLRVLLLLYKVQAYKAQKGKGEIDI